MVERETKPTVVTVLGMQRSGTSLVAKLLNSLGVNLGPENRLMRANVGNPKGYWEHQTFNDVIAEIFERLGGEWANPPKFPNAWETAAEFEDLRERARGAIQRDFAGSPMWGWKEPGTSLTLPFWRPLVPPLHHVICMRHPLDVARSLERRDGKPLATSIELWLMYTEAALNNTEGEDRILVFYEDVMDNWQEELSRLAHFIGRPEVARLPDVHRTVADFVDRTLHHHHSAADDLQSLNVCGEYAGALAIYTALKREGSEGVGTLRPTFEAALESIAPYAAQGRRDEVNRWIHQVRMAKDELRDFIPRGSSFVLADGQEFNWSAPASDRQAVALMERKGEDWGPPPDDQTAIRELERHRQHGASWMVFGFPAFWWLEYYGGFCKYLRSQFACVVDNERLVAFDLRSDSRNR